MFLHTRADEKFLPEYSRRSEEAYQSSKYGEGGGFCVGVPPQTGLIGVHNPKGCWDGGFSAVASVGAQIGLLRDNVT